MKKIILLTIFLTASVAIRMAAQDAIFPKGEKAANVHHVGNVWLNEISHADSVFTYSIAVATFDPGARLDWHSHPGGQILLISAGTGYYQEKGEPKQTVHKGDVIRCAPRVEHWHGATANSDFTYIATTPTEKGKTIWLQRVTDAEYNSK